MKIEANSPALGLLPVNPGAKKVSNSGSASIQSTTEDSTSFQTDSQSVQALTSQAMKSPEIRQDKVDALTQSVNSGEYKPDASKTASAIIASEG